MVVISALILAIVIFQTLMILRLLHSPPKVIVEQTVASEPEAPIVLQEITQADVDRARMEGRTSAFADMEALKAENSHPVTQVRRMLNRDDQTEIVAICRREGISFSEAKEKFDAARETAIKEARANENGMDHSSN